MEKGYYLFAYVEINKYANFYKTDTKRHDQNISLWEYDGGKLSLLRYWELERLSRIKHHNKAFYSETQFKNIVNEFAGALQPVDRRKAGHATEINLPV